MAAIGYHSVSLHGQDDLQLDEHTEMEYDRRLVTSAGTVTDVFKRGCDLSVINFPAFEVEAEYPPGLSGSPIFDAEGFVRAVVSSGLGLGLTEDGTVDTGPSKSVGCPIAPVMDAHFGTGDMTLSVHDLAVSGDVHVREVHGD